MAVGNFAAFVAFAARRMLDLLVELLEWLELVLQWGDWLGVAELPMKAWHKEARKNCLLCLAACNVIYFSYVIIMRVYFWLCKVQTGKGMRLLLLVEDALSAAGCDCWV